MQAWPWLWKMRVFNSLKRVFGVIYLLKRMV